VTGRVTVSLTSWFVEETPLLMLSEGNQGILGEEELGSVNFGAVLRHRTEFDSMSVLIKPHLS